MKKKYVKNIMFLFCFFLFVSININASDSIVENENPELLQHKSDSSILSTLHMLNQTTWQLKYDEKKKDLLLRQKNELFRALLLNIKDVRQSFGIDIEVLKDDYTQARKNLAISDDSILDELTLYSLAVKYELFVLFQNLRKQVDFFAHKQEVIELIRPSLTNLNALPDSFKIPKHNAKAQDEQAQYIKKQIMEYSNQLTTAIELANYLEKHAAEFIPQDTLLHNWMRFILKQITGFTTIINYENIFIVKILLSLICFGVLWAFRKLITKCVLYAMSFAMHLTNQNNELRLRIQASLLKPISLFLLVWSMRVCVGVVYYPELPPEKFDVWFIILYIVNFAWFVLILVKSYGAVLLTNILQKSNDGFRKEIINLILKTIYSIIVIIALLAILKSLGFNVSAIIASLGLGGLAVALAVKDMLANFFASVMLLLDNSFSQGDWIECGGIEGIVVEIGLRRTKIRTFENALLFVPNSDLAGKTVRNWSRRRAGRRMKMSVGVTYSATREQLKKCVEEIRDMLANHEQIAMQPKYSTEELQLMKLQKDIISIDDYLGYKTGISVCVEALGDSSINILVDCFTESVDKKQFYEVREEVIFNIMQIVERCNLSFAFPSQSVYIESLPRDSIVFNKDSL